MPHPGHAPRCGGIRLALKRQLLPGGPSRADGNAGLFVVGRAQATAGSGPGAGQTAAHRDTLAFFRIKLASVTFASSARIPPATVVQAACNRASSGCFPANGASPL